MHRVPLALGSLMLSVAPAALVSAGAAYAQTTPSPPTTVEVETSTVERDVTVTTLDSSKVTTPDADTNGDDDSDKTGLWGLLGLLGLLGLAGLARKKRGDNDVTTRPPTMTPAPPTASGATSRTDRP